MELPEVGEAAQNRPFWRTLTKHNATLRSYSGARSYWIDMLVTLNTDVKFCFPSSLSYVSTLPWKLPVYCTQVALHVFFSRMSMALTRAVIRWLWKEPVDCSRCSKWQSFASPHACSHILHWLASSSGCFARRQWGTVWHSWMSCLFLHQFQNSSQRGFGSECLVATDLSRWIQVFPSAANGLLCECSVYICCPVIGF